MATAEIASASLAPRYAPEDPTLLKPWKGLIDGSTDLLYYWNPETDITQYERPAALSPLLPPAFTPKLAPIPIAHSLQPNGILAQQGHQMNQTPQKMYQGVPQQGQLAPQKQDTQTAQGACYKETQMMQGLQQWGPQITRGTQQQGHQTPQHQGQQMPPQQVKHFPHQQLPVPYQQTLYAQTHQILQHQGQEIPHQQGQQFMPQQGQKMGFAQREENGFQQGKQVGFSPSQIQLAGGLSHNNLPSGTHFWIPQIDAHSVEPQKFLNSSSNTLETAIGSTCQQQMGEPMVQNQAGPTMGREPPIGLKMGYEEDTRGRAGNEFFFNASKAGSMMAPQQPKLAALPMTQNQQGMRIPQSITSDHAGGPNSVAGNALPHIYNHVASGKTFTDNSGMIPPPGLLASSDVTNLSPVEMYRQKHEVTATGGNVPAPFMNFEATGFPPEILREVNFAGFSSPTPIQAQTWPIALQSRDIVAIAKTGSGKTLGYLIPAFIHLKKCRNRPQKGPVVLVLAPTRELATQIRDEVIKFGRSSRISCTCLYGGAPKGPQLKELHQGTDIVVATPGRLNDILEMKKIDFLSVSFLVLDEADRMLDMGFEPQIRKIVNKIPPRRQTLMYTATWPKEVRKIAGDLLVNPVQVNIGNVDELAANKAITQYVEVVPQMNKQRRLEQILRAQEHGSKVIIFCSTKRLCDQLARGIGRNFGAAVIHGDKSQGERDWVLNQFRSGKSPILVATDVAARGLDIKDIRMVINYDFPNGVEDYIHRIGRTGRAGATGISFTFFCDQDRKHAADLVKVLEGTNQRVPPEVREMVVRGGPSFGKFRGGMNRYDSGGGQLHSRGRGGMRDGGFGGCGGRNDFGGRGNRGQGFSGPGVGPVGWGRHDRGRDDQYNDLDGRGRFNHQRGIADGRRKNYSPSSDGVRTRDYHRSRSRSRSNSSSSRSCSHHKFERSREQSCSQHPSGSEDGATLESQLPPVLPSIEVHLFPVAELPGKLPVAESPVAGGESSLPSVADL